MKGTELSSVDYMFRAQVCLVRGSRLELPCKLFLPKRVEEFPRLELLATGDAYDLLTYSTGPYQISGEIESVGTVKTEEAYLVGALSRFWGDLAEGTVAVQPWDFLMSGECRPVTCTVGLFRLTDSRLLKPPNRRKCLKDGEIHVEAG